MKRMLDDLFIASIRRMFSSPGIPKTYLTPSFSRHFTIRFATGITISLFEEMVTSLSSFFGNSYSFMFLDSILPLFPFVRHYNIGFYSEYNDKLVTNTIYRKTDILIHIL